MEALLVGKRRSYILPMHATLLAVIMTLTGVMVADAGASDLRAAAAPAFILACTLVASVLLLFIRRWLRFETTRADRSEEWRLRFADGWPDLVFETDSDGTLTSVSSACTAFLGVTPDQMVGRPLSDYVQMGVDEVGLSSPSRLLRWRHADGSSRVLQTTLVPVTHHDQSPMLGIASDARQLEDAVRLRRRAEDRVEAIIEAVPNGIMLVGRGGQQCTGNERFARLFGLAASDLRDRNPSEFLPEEIVTELSALLGATEFGIAEPRHVDLTVGEEDGPKRSLELSMMPFDIDGEVAGVVMETVDITDRAQHAAELRYMAEFDQLTGLPNRFKMEQQIASSLDRARSAEDHVGVLLIDLDRFKLINDTLGHHVGDRLLSSVADRIAEALPEDYVVARFGGDEFMVLTPPLDDARGAARAAATVCQSLAERFEIDGSQVHVGGSVGVAMYPEDGVDAATLMRRADAAMYRAKELGGDGYQFANHSTDAELHGRVEIEADLRRAVEQGEFVMYYMPEVRIGDGSVATMEALVRWENPDRGLVPPSAFVPLLEELNLIDAVGEWVLEEACRQSLRWKEQGLGDVAVSVNISPLQLRRQNLAETVQHVLERTGLAPNLLELEVTENATLRSPEQAFLTLGELRRLGVRVAVDDFGTGHSSLTRLRELPIDTIKIDRSFVSDLAQAGDAYAIVSGVIALGHAMELSVVAEGVETNSQLRTLETLGCDIAQGFLVSRPLPAEACLSVLRERNHGRHAA